MLLFAVNCSCLYLCITVYNVISFMCIYVFVELQVKRDVNDVDVLFKCLC